LRKLIQGYANLLNSIGRYQCKVVGNVTLDIVPLIQPVRFLHVSPSASADGSSDFLTFLRNNPSPQLAAKWASAAPEVGQPSPESVEELRLRLHDPTVADLDKLEALYGAFSQIDPRVLEPVLRNVVLPWFFAKYPGGRVLAVTLTEAASTYEDVARNLYATSLYGFEATYGTQERSARSKPLTRLMSSIEARVLNIARALTTYNGPWMDAFCIGGVYTTFVFVPDESIHRRSIDRFGIEHLTSPFSSVSAQAQTFEEGGNEDLVRPIHDKRSAADTDEWLRYWFDRADKTFDRLYDLSRASDAAGSIDLGNYMRQILQFERLLFEIGWCCSTLDQFLRKVVAYAVVDKVTAFMSFAPCVLTRPGEKGTEKYVHALSEFFIKNRLPQLFDNPTLVANGARWLATIYDAMSDSILTHSYPYDLLSAGTLDVAASYDHLRPMDKLPGIRGKSTTIDKSAYVAQVIRALRNTHHGYLDLNEGPFAVLSTADGSLSEDIALLVPFFCFAMLDKPDEALRRQW
jgi:hypothetical protein